MAEAQMMEIDEQKKPLEIILTPFGAMPCCKLIP